MATPLHNSDDRLFFLCLQGNASACAVNGTLNDMHKQ